MLMRLAGNDTTVPLSWFARLVDQATARGSTVPDANTVAISEIGGKDHWFDGIMDDAVMHAFYTNHLAKPLPPLPRFFESVTINPASTTGRGGVRIEQLRIPYRLS